MKRTKSEAEKTKINILNSAIKVFLKNGYSKTTLSDIAKDAGFTRGAVYWHFKDKSEILETLITKFDDRFTAKNSDLMQSPIDPISKIRAIIDINFPLLYQNKEFRDFIELTWFKTEIDQHKGLLQSKRKIANEFNDSITTLLKEAANKGYLKAEVDPEIAALSITTILNGLYRGYFIIPDKLKSEKTGTIILENYLNQIKT
jgi:TetR/AcrR family acrAB operon transcriptional repressor